MAKTKINTQSVIDATTSAKSAKNTTVNVGTSVNNIRWRTDSKILGRNGVSWSFTNIQNSISQIATDIGKICQYTDSAVSQYECTENKIIQDGRNMGVLEAKSNSACGTSVNKAAYEALFDVKKVSEAGSVGATDENTTSKDENGVGESLLDLFSDLIGEAGAVGKVVDGTMDLIRGVGSGDGIEAGKAIVGGILKPATSIIGDIAEEAFKDADKMDWKGLVFGQWKSGSALEKLEQVADAYPNSTKFGAAFWDDLSSFTFKNADTVGDKIKVGAKWAGTLLSAVTNGIDNYGEYQAGEISEGRAVAETITETVVDVGIGALTTAAASVAVGAAATALGVAAPAIAIGAVAVGITWAADSVTKWATKKITGEEKGLTELVSDTILNVGEGIGKGVGNLAKKAGAGIKNAFGNIGSKWRACFG